jgi:hypothetical protein
MARKRPNRERTPPNETPASSEDRIRIRAFEIWLHNGCRDGCDVEDWLQAEEQLRTEGAAAPRSAGAAG